MKTDEVIKKTLELAQSQLSNYKKNDVALDTDSGIISMALEIYAKFVQDMGGPSTLQQRALELSTIYRSYADEEREG